MLNPNGGSIYGHQFDQGEPSYTASPSREIVNVMRLDIEDYRLFRQRFDVLFPGFIVLFSEEDKYIRIYDRDFQLRAEIPNATLYRKDYIWNNQFHVGKGTARAIV